MNSNSSLGRVYQKLLIPEEDRRRLATIHNVTTYERLCEVRESLEDHKLATISISTQHMLACAIIYIDWIQIRDKYSDSVDAINNFDRKQFFLMFRKRGANTSKESADSTSSKPKTRKTADDAVEGASKCPRIARSQHTRSKESMPGKTPREEIESKLASCEPILANQGFVPSTVYESNDDGDDTDIDRPDKTVSEFELDNKTYVAGRCYTYCGPESKQKEVLVGIKHINPITAKAKCVWIWQKSDTFLGKMNTEAFNSASESWGEYVQGREDVDPLPLSNFTGEFSKLRTIPAVCYLRQLEGSRQTLGYFTENNSCNRFGHRTEKLRLLELYSGAGGCHQGYKSEGFETAGVVELCPVAMKTFRHNNKDVPIDRTFNESVESFLDKYMNYKAFRNMIGPIDVLHASPPCQGFSKANVNGGKNDERNRQESPTFLEVVRAAKPSIVTYENVEGMWCEEHITYVSTIQTALLDTSQLVRDRREENET